MISVTAYDTTTGNTVTLSLSFTGCRADLLTYMGRIYPHYRVLSVAG